MARIGDFMQTTPLLKGFQRHSRVAVLVDESIAGIAGRCCCADEIIGIDIKTVFSVMNGSGSVNKLFEAIKDGIADLKDMFFDTVLNVNHSALSALLSHIPKSARVSGYRFNHALSRIEPDNWFVFLRKMVKYRPLAPFNLADVFYYSAHKPDTHPLCLGYDLSHDDREKAGAIFSAAGISERDSVVAFQVGANSPGRQWPQNNFAELAIKTMGTGARVLLLGTDRDRDTANLIIKTVMDKKPHLREALIDMTGKTSVSDIAPVLSRCDLLVTGDTGPMHIASAVGCRVIALFFGPAYLFETGPYGQGHYVIQADIGCCPCMDSTRCRYDAACSRTIDPDMVFNLVRCVIFDEQVPVLPANGVRFYTSGTDRWGVTYHPLNEKRLSAESLRNLCYREMGTCLADPECEISTEIPGYCIEDEGYIEDETGRLRQLMYMYYNHPASVHTALFDQQYGFWHPWIEWHKDMTDRGDRGAGQVFAGGLNKALKFLNHLRNN